MIPDLRSKNNTISVAISLEAGADQERGEGEERSRGAGAGQLTQIGSMLFTRGVSGTRVITGVCRVYTSSSIIFGQVKANLRSFVRSVQD